MTGEDLFLLGKNSPAARACIPLHFVPTVPKLRREGQWLGEIWYYKVQYQDQSVCVPQYRMTLCLPSGNPVEMRELPEAGFCLGGAPEIVTPEFYEAQNRYLERCSALLERTVPTDEELTSLQTAWLEVQPACLATWFQNGGRRQPDTLPQPQDLIEYWQQEYAKAIRSGNPQQIQKAQRELKRAAEKSQYKK